MCASLERHQNHSISIEDTNTMHYKRLVCHDCPQNSPRSKRYKPYTHIKWVTEQEYQEIKTIYPENLLSPVA
jgi:hypothetical protein